MENILQNPFVFWPIVAWSLAWKGLALWRAAQLRQKIWFVAIFVISTIGILDILYLFVFSKVNKTRTKDKDLNA